MLLPAAAAAAGAAGRGGTQKPDANVDCVLKAELPPRGPLPDMLMPFAEGQQRAMLV